VTRSADLIGTKVAKAFSSNFEVAGLDLKLRGGPGGYARTDELSLQNMKVATQINGAALEGRGRKNAEKI
jgi:hypothetical protein